MNDYEYEIRGAPVDYTNIAPEPNNPLNRPKIKFTKPIFAIVICVMLNIGLYIMFEYSKAFFECQDKYCKMVEICSFVITNIVYVLLILKKALIWFVHLYQRYAPDEVRLKCVFEPSCSEYMILAIKKYGGFKGVLKGVQRLLRCHPPNGGKDYP